jgi:hypothetical protein
MATPTGTDHRKGFAPGTEVKVAVLSIEDGGKRIAGRAAIPPDGIEMVAVETREADVRVNAMSPVAATPASSPCDFSGVVLGPPAGASPPPSEHPANHASA